VSFWDSSALVPLVVDEPRTALAKTWQEEDVDIVIWTLTAVEITSALWCLVRDGALTEADARKAEGIAGELCARVSIVTDVERVKALAVRLLRVHRLRAADALQLAAGLAWGRRDAAGPHLAHAGRAARRRRRTRRLYRLFRLVTRGRSASTRVDCYARGSQRRINRYSPSVMPAAMTMPPIASTA
jgi:hypothetical protein